MESIKLRFEYKSQNNNGWPLMMVTVGDVVLSRFQADQTSWQQEFAVPAAQEHSLKIWHYGKNYITDHTPDKFFHLEKIWINGVDLRDHMGLIKQTAFIAPWDQVSPPSHSLYLGHNGYLELKFATPVVPWIQNLFKLNRDTMHGQQTTREVLNSVKDYFDKL